MHDFHLTNTYSAQNKTPIQKNKTAFCQTETAFLFYQNGEIIRSFDHTKKGYRLSKERHPHQIYTNYAFLQRQRLDILVNKA